MNQRIFTYLLLQMTTSSATACCCEKKMCEENPGHIITNQICIPHNLVPPSGSSSSSSVIGRPTQSIRIPPLHHYIEQHVATTMRHDAMRPHSYLRTWSAVGIYGPPPLLIKGTDSFKPSVSMKRSHAQLHWQRQFFKNTFANLRRKTT
jgi:hypothetical protein